MTARKHRRIHDVEQTEMMIPFITIEITFRQHVGELVFGINVFHVDLWVQIDSVKIKIQRNSVGSGLVSHRQTSVLDDHFDHCFVVFKNVQLDNRCEKVLRVILDNSSTSRPCVSSF